MLQSLGSPNLIVAYSLGLESNAGCTTPTCIRLTWEMLTYIEHATPEKIRREVFTSILKQRERELLRVSGVFNAERNHSRQLRIYADARR
jgi:hypothetical protein